jgi:hypothetical protein
MLDAGRASGLKENTEFEIMEERPPIKTRDGRLIPNNKLVARVRITRIDPESSQAQVLKTFGDSGAPDPTPVAGKVKVDMVARMVASEAPADDAKKK